MGKRTKICSMCKKRKPVEQFYKDKRARDGLYSCCKPCHLGKTSRHYQENREYVLERQATYYREHPERKKAAVDKWAKKNPENSKQRSKRYRERHPERITQFNKRYYEANAEAMRQRTIDYHKKHGRNRNWTKHNEGVWRYRARKLDAFVADVVLDDVIQRDEGRCGICGDPVMGPLEMDHIIPLSRKGTHEPENVQLAHRLCNRRKGTK